MRRMIVVRIEIKTICIQKIAMNVAGQAELARKLDASVGVTDFHMLFAACRARVQVPL